MRDVNKPVGTVFSGLSALVIESVTDGGEVVRVSGGCRAGSARFLSAATVSGDGGPARAGVGAEVPGAVAGVVDVEAFAVGGVAVADSDRQVAAHDVGECRGAAAPEPGHGVLAVRSEVQVGGAFAVVVVDPDQRRVLCPSADACGRPHPRRRTAARSRSHQFREAARLTTRELGLTWLLRAL